MCQAEFTTLAEWVREKTLFDLISSIRFFKNYLTGRAFRRWHKVCAGLLQGSEQASRSTPTVPCEQLPCYSLDCCRVSSRAL